MALQRHNKKEGTLKERFAKRPSKKLESPQGKVAKGSGTGSGEHMEEDTAPITRSFLEQLFEVLREDFATLRQEIATEVKDLKRDVTELGQRIDRVKRTHDAKEEELDHYRQKILTLRDSN
ncbi:hypothetical protein NDU88_007731 [Pleurodeles waltl]|uniref:Uncharacterized protein n=1 Tax=Pleurodeles waltl TaxID=8319 RepID=A0AAV7STB9_PLEWA|nr:hypothetical protein NDU88_007731 [Pleurodeles waltl]